MIDALTVFTRGGIVLWSFYFIKLKGNPIEMFIKNFLLEERSSECVCQCEGYRLRWLMANELDLIFVVVYQGIQQFIYMDSILDTVKNIFLKNIILICGDIHRRTFKDNLKKFVFNGKTDIFNNKMLFNILDKCENLVKTQNRINTMRTYQQTKKGGGKGGGGEEKKNYITGGGGGGGGGREKKKNGGEEEEEEEEEGDEEEENNILKNTKNNLLLNGGFSADKKSNKLQSLRNKNNSSFSRNSTQPNSAEVDGAPKKSKKEARSWNEQKVTKKKMEELDHSKKTAANDENTNSQINETLPLQHKQFFCNSDEEDALSSHQQSEESDFEEELMSSGKPTLFSRLTSALQNITGNKVIREEDIEGTMKDFKSILMSKNVAEEISEKITQSVKRSVLGSKTERFTSVRLAVKNALAESIQNVLSPQKSIDVAMEALSSRSQGRVYSIVFLGINGVGKSTSLAKVCYYLKKRGLKVMIAACDTFRAGAVEQLRTHARCLDVHLFERGYGKDAAYIAREAITYARNEGYDVVLIDTAGRMQDNEPLMRALGKLIGVNNPNLILFVGEALVGNDAVDQLKKFNEKLIDMSQVANRRCIDGMILTKFDTVDDKVGAALSMTYITGQPIVFVGTGQKYGHLSKLHVSTVVKALLG